MSDKTEPSDFEKSLLLLENDLDALGWDQPARFYAVMGESDSDLHLDLVCEVGGHPVDFLRTLVGTGRFDDSVKGACLATEAWRSPSHKDFKKKWPDRYQTMLEGAREKFPEFSEEDFEKGLDEALMNSYRPSQHPGRVEIRTVLTIMRDGRVFSINRDRDGEPEISKMSSTSGRLVDAIKATLTGCWKVEEEDIRS